MVYVVSKSGKPLMPTKRFGRVKRLLKNKQAKIVDYKPFTIQLLYDSTEYTQPLTLGIDTGSTHIGVSVTKDNGEPVYLAELETRTPEVTKNMENRKLHRQARRRHRRDKRKRRAVKAETVFTEKEYLIRGCEKPVTCKLIKPGRIKFENRNRTEKWLTPTGNHLLNTHINFVKKIAAILPITNVVVEYAKFDISKLADPDVKRKDYQNGRMKGYTNASEYVLCRDKHNCQLCAGKTGKMNVHHVVWRSDGGSDTPENLITLCEKCHEKVHNKPKINQKVVEKFKGLKKRFAQTTLLNSIMPKFYKWLEETFPEISKTYGYETKEKRREYDLPKAHWIDAYLVGTGDLKPSDLLLKPFQFKQFRRHNRANIQRQEDRKYYIGKKKVAVNRNKRAGQTFDSLADLVEKEGNSILNQLTVKPARRRKRSIKPFGMGDIVEFEKKRFVVKGFMANYLGFAGEEKYNKLIKKTHLLLKNQGICCL
ncbi:MAG: RNA-guided endonuclease IscB [Thermodesulfobacteriota bacterium]|nr:RNA-guided endonuclease IscB [Thermodesulfobacteriota bacterium]